MFASGDPESHATAARQLTLASFYDPELDGAVDALLTSADTRIRTESVGVFAANIAHKPRLDRSQAVVAAAFDDPETEVRDEAQRVFYRIQSDDLGDYDGLFRAITTSRALSDGATSAVHTLEDSAHPLPPSSLELCEALIEEHGPSMGDISTKAAGDAVHISRLVLRLYVRSEDAEVRSRCLDMIDQLVVLGAHGIETDLDSTER